MHISITSLHVFNSIRDDADEVTIECQIEEIDGQLSPATGLWSFSVRMAASASITGYILSEDINTDTAEADVREIAPRLRGRTAEETASRWLGALQGAWGRLGILVHWHLGVCDDDGDYVTPGCDPANADDERHDCQYCGANAHDMDCVKCGHRGPDNTWVADDEEAGSYDVYCRVHAGQERAWQAENVYYDDEDTDDDGHRDYDLEDDTVDDPVDAERLLQGGE